MTAKNLCRSVINVKPYTAAFPKVVHQGLLAIPGQNPIVENGSKLCGWLVCLQGPQKGQDFRLFESTYRIGAHPTAEIVVTGPEVRSFHANLEVLASGVELSPAVAGRDLKVNGEPLTEAFVLHDGDDISLGQLRFQFRSAALFQPGYRPLYRSRANTQLIFSVANQDFVTGWILLAGTHVLDMPDLRLSTQAITIGAAESCDWCFRSCDLAERHARITFEHNRLMLEAFESESFPCYVNGQPILTKTQLRDSDQISFGRFSGFVKTW